jgi:hypothetical protein
LANFFSSRSSGDNDALIEEVVVAILLHQCNAIAINHHSWHVASLIVASITTSSSIT